MEKRNVEYTYDWYSASGGKNGNVEYTYCWYSASGGKKYDMHVIISRVKL
jgi:hypothetical protein